MLDSREAATSAIQSLNELRPLGAGKDTSATAVGDKQAGIGVHRKAQETCPGSLAFVKVSGTYTAYADAKAACAAENYTLPMPKSFPLQSNLQDCLKNDEIVFLGLTDLANEGAFVWDDGTPLNTTGYSKWFDSQPNDPNGGQE
jgi:hypothetical protein